MAEYNFETVLPSPYNLIFPHFQNIGYVFITIIHFVLHSGHGTRKHTQSRELLKI